MSAPSSKQTKSDLSDNRNNHIILSLVSLATLVLTFLISTSDLSYNTKLLMFLGLVLVYGLFASKYYFGLMSKAGESGSEIRGDLVFDRETEEKLSVLDEANAFFSASLKPEDMFRLISSRIGEVVDFQSCVLFSLDEESRFVVKYAAGKNSNSFLKVSIGCDEGLAGRTHFSEEIELDPNLRLERRAIQKSTLDGMESAVAIPLKKATEVFAVLILYSETENDFGGETLDLLEAISERVAPLLNSSFSYEKSLSNSMTDALTDLPNERAFHLVLENQLAESQRFQSSRPLTVLAFDVKEFSEFNSKFGHASGDRMLKFASHSISNQLRKMDFLARFNNDEFWAVIPTASSELAKTIIERIENAFIEKPFPLSGGESYVIKLNIGAASFGEDGETAKQLLQIARLRKRQAKADENNSVIIFPTQQAK